MTMENNAGGPPTFQANAPPIGAGNPKKQQEAMMQDTVNQMNSMSARLRILEDRYTNMRKRDQVIEQNMLTNHKNASADLKELHVEISDVNREINVIKNKIKLIISDLNNFARKDEVKVLERYVNLWEPIKYATYSEAEKIARRVFEELSKQ